MHITRSRRPGPASRFSAPASGSGVSPLLVTVASAERSADDARIRVIDGNYNETLPLRLERAETVVYLQTPSWLCASRALERGLRSPDGEMPEGCDDSPIRRLRDEWGGVGRIWCRLSRTPGAHAPSCCGTGLIRRCTCSARGGRRGSSSTPFVAREHHPPQADSAELPISRLTNTEDRGMVGGPSGRHSLIRAA